MYVSTSKDPYVYAQYNGTLHFSNKAQSYGTAGIWLIAIATSLALVPIFIIYKNKQKYQRQRNSELEGYEGKNSITNRTNQSNYFNRSADESKLEMNDLHPLTKEEDELKYLAKRT